MSDGIDTKPKPPTEDDARGTVFNVYRRKRKDTEPLSRRDERSLAKDESIVKEAFSGRRRKKRGGGKRSR